MTTKQRLPIILLFSLFSGFSVFAFDLPRTPPIVAVQRSQVSFIGEVLETDEISSSGQGVTTAFAMVRIVTPIKCSPNVMATIMIEYHPLYEVGSCLDLEDITKGSIILFTFQHDLSNGIYEISYCWPNIDLAYSMVCDAQAMTQVQLPIQLHLLSGSWNGKVTIEQIIQNNEAL
jgi:hypothetical protein